MDRLPKYDYLYLGDTKRVPYGGRSQETIHEFVSQALSYLFAHDCQLVILACNTASAESLRKSQQEYLPRHFPERRVLGVIIPTVEAVLESGTGRSVGVLATRSTVESGAYVREIHRHAQLTEVEQVAAPLLVPLVENAGLKYLEPVLADYLNSFSRRPEALILGCTHYCLIKEQVRSMSGVRVFSPDEIVPDKTANYLARHPEMEERLGRAGERLYHVTDFNPGYGEFARLMAGSEIRFEKVSLD